jgi:tRNA pseudouridine38-40 synthase
VQDRLEAALCEFTQQRISTLCAGRTDAGVHALMQVVHFDTSVDRDANSWVRGTNAALPAAMAVQWAQPVADDFNARYAAEARTYRYLLYNHPVRPAVLAGNAGWFHAPLDTPAMRAAAPRLSAKAPLTFRRRALASSRPCDGVRRVRSRRSGTQGTPVARASAGPARPLHTYG